MVAGATVFLRLPMGFHDAYREGSAGWTRTLPMAGARARAATLAPSDRRPADVTSRPPLDVLPVSGPYRFVPPADVSLQPLVAQSRPLATLIEGRLSDLQDFGDGGGSGDVLYLLGADGQATADYAVAADYFETFALSDECELTCGERAATLENAIAFRRALGQTSRALRNADDFEVRYAGTEPRAATRVAFAAAEMTSGVERAERLERLRRRRLPPAEAIQAEVRLGTSLLRTDPARAHASFRRADRIWRSNGGAQMSTSPGLDSAEWIGELSRTREAVAEARFQRAESRFRAAERVAPPSYEGPPTQHRVEAFVERRLRPWLARRLRRLRSAEAALDEVDEVGLSSFSVPAAARRGELYQSLADELASLDVPEAITPDDPEEGFSVRQSTAPLHRRLVVPALERFDRCMAAAHETRNYGTWSDRCADALARYEPRWRRPELTPRVLRVSSEMVPP